MVLYPQFETSMYWNIIENNFPMDLVIAIVLNLDKENKHKPRVRIGLLWIGPFSSSIRLCSIKSHVPKLNSTSIAFAANCISKFVKNQRKQLLGMLNK